MGTITDLHIHEVLAQLLEGTRWYLTKVSYLGPYKLRPQGRPFELSWIAAGLWPAPPLSWDASRVPKPLRCRLLPELTEGQGEVHPLESQLSPVEECQGIGSIYSKLEREIFLWASFSFTRSCSVYWCVGTYFILLDPDTFVSVCVLGRFVYAHVYMYICIY